MRTYVTQAVGRRASLPRQQNQSLRPPFSFHAVRAKDRHRTSVDTGKLTKGDAHLVMPTAVRCLRASVLPCLAVPCLALSRPRLSGDDDNDDVVKM
jgi:hypothetical protein